MDGKMQHRVEKEIYLMLHTQLETERLLNMQEAELDWWVALVRFLKQVKRSGRRRGNAPGSSAPPGQSRNRGWCAHRMCGREICRPTRNCLVE